MFHSLPRWVMSAVLLTPALASHAQTIAPLPPQTRLVAVSGAASVTEQDFSIAAAQDLVVTLTDLQVPAALASATVVVTQMDTVVGNATFSSPATSATFSLPGAVGKFSLRVFGVPNASFSVGTFAVCVAPKSDPANCLQSASIAGNISAAASVADPTVSTISLSLTVLTAGTYSVTFADDQFPAPLNTPPNLALFQGSQPIQLGIQSGATVNLSPGTYTLLGIAQADPAAKAGLYGISITGPAGTAALLSATFPVGSLPASSKPNNDTAQSLTLKVTDFEFPSPLAGAAALVTSGAAVLGSTSLSAATGPVNFAAPSGPLQVWSFATAGSDAGTYEVDLTSPDASVLQTAAAVNSGNSLAFAFTSSSLAAGSYQAIATDFQFPAVLPVLKFGVAQNGVILQQAAAATTLNFTTPVAGSVIVLANAAIPANGSGLFDVNVQSVGTSPTLLFDKTQAVSANDLFDTQTINLGTSGNYTVTLTDLKLPAAFQDLDLVVSSGGAVLGKIIGGGSFPIAVTPGAYQLTFIATPASQQQFGLYGLAIAPSAPTVSLTASSTSVTSGSAVTLTWTSANATTCTGSGGGFAGSQATSGTLSVSITAATTFDLSCTGPGGAASQSVTVSFTNPPAKSGGGGALDLCSLNLLGLLGLARSRRDPTNQIHCKNEG
jgi:hypothetical protein